MGVLSGGLSLPNRPMISAPDTSWTGSAGPCQCPAGLQQEARHSPGARQDQKQKSGRLRWCGNGFCHHLPKVVLKAGFHVTNHNSDWTSMYWLEGSPILVWCLPARFKWHFLGPVVIHKCWCEQRKNDDMSRWYFLQGQTSQDKIWIWTVISKCGPCGCKLWRCLVKI